MGGKALKEFNVQRVDKVTFNKIVNKLSVELDLLVKTNVIQKYNFTKTYDSKDTFGDCDILYIGNETTIQKLKDHFEPIGFINNGDCFSFVYQYEDINFQVDMIKSEESYYDYNLEYFNFSDLGNLLGVVAKKLGFKVSHKGLLYTLKLNNQFVRDITITTDWNKSLEFLKFYDIKDSYDSIEDIFIDVSKCQYFNPKLYLFESRNHDARTRDRKRPTYNSFLSWLEINEFQFAFDYDKINLDKLKLYMFNRAKCMFGFRSSFVYEIEKIEQEFINTQLIKEKFNGKIVQEITGLKDKELGDFIKYFKTLFVNFEEYILSPYTTIELIKSDINIALYNTFSN